VIPNTLSQANEYVVHISDNCLKLVLKISANNGGLLSMKKAVDVEITPSLQKWTHTIYTTKNSKPLSRLHCDSQLMVGWSCHSMAVIY
jgi:hypothetical protein